MKIHITGNAGAGKTTLAREIAARAGLRLHHLDGYVWRPGWKKADPEERDRAIQALCEHDSWIIEGVSQIVRERADVVVYIDSPRWLCMWRCVLRCLRVGFRTRPELPQPCPEIYILFRAMALTYRFPRRVGQLIKAEANGRPHYLLTKNVESARSELQRYLAFDRG